MNGPGIFYSTASFIEELTNVRKSHIDDYQAVITVHGGSKILVLISGFFRFSAQFSMSENRILIVILFIILVITLSFLKFCASKSL